MRRLVRWLGRLRWWRRRWESVSDETLIRLRQMEDYLPESPGHRPIYRGRSSRRAYVQEVER